VSTTVLAVDALSPEPEPIQRAAEVLLRGGIVAFPTETVYGLGARAHDKAALRRVFEAKGRPAAVPLIVHVTGVEQARGYVAHFPRLAERLAAAFWPGPLSLVLARAPSVPREVAGGGETVAVRAPAHPVALALLRATGEPIAAPSANPYGGVPPVRASHVLKGLGGRVDLVLDAGVRTGGLESTVLDLTGERPRILRRGAVGVDAIRAAVGEVLEPGAGETRSDPSVPRGLGAGGWLRVATADEIDATLQRDRGALAGRVGALVRSPELGARLAAAGVVVRLVRDDPEGFAAEMYDALHELDDAGCAEVAVEALASRPEWDALADRIRRLAREIGNR
jgi:L-threonylcarbamoyladenylate synthase